MSSPENDSLGVDNNQPVGSPSSPQKGPVNFLSGAITSGLFAWLSLV